MTALKRKTHPPLRSRLLALLAVIISVGLALAAWSSGLRIALDIAVRYSFANPDINSGQQIGIVRTVRIAMMICGGVIWLIVALASIGYHSENLGRPRSWKILAWTIGIELAIIGVDVLMQL